MESETHTIDRTLVNRNIMVLGRRTSVRLEPEMWLSLREISKIEGCTMHQIYSFIYMNKNIGSSLTSAIRVFLLLYYRSAATKDGHISAGHGQLKQKMNDLDAGTQDWNRQNRFQA